MIDAPDLTKVIINVVVYHHGVLEPIIKDQGSLFTSIFWFLIYYFLGIKKSYLQLFIYKRIVRPRDKTA